jgi:hypothetical protein
MWQVPNLALPLYQGSENREDPRTLRRAAWRWGWRRAAGASSTSLLCSTRFEPGPLLWGILHAEEV